MTTSLDFAKLYKTEAIGQILVVIKQVNGNPAITIKFSSRVFGRGERRLIFLGDQGNAAANEYFKKMTEASAINQVLLAFKSKILEVNIK